MLTQKKPGQMQKFLLGSLIASFFIVAIGAKNGVELNKPKPAPADYVPAQMKFDIPKLVGKNLSGVEALLGKGEGIDPTAQQINLGAKTWDKTFHASGSALLVTYDIKTNRIVDFFIATDDPSGKTSNPYRLLTFGNVEESNPKYTIEFVRTISDPDFYTGMKVIPK